MTNKNPITDFYGREPSVGDRIVYAGRRGSSLWLTEAVVEYIDEVHPYFGWQNTTKITVKPTGSDRSSILTNPTFVILKKPWE